MKNRLTILFFVLCWGVSNLYGQTSLETTAKMMNVSINMPAYFNVSQNKDFIYVTEITEKDPIPTIAQSYRFKPSYGNTALKVLFGMVHAIIEHKNGEYLTFIVLFPIKGGGRYSDLAFERIKKDFRYGKPMNAASEQEEYELNLKLTHYPKEEARKMFNANIMATYPFDLEGNIYKEKYTQCKALVINKGGFDMYLYFMMTDETVKNFDTYVKDFDKVFWFDESINNENRIW